MSHTKQPLTSRSLDSLKPFERCFYELSETQSELLDREDPDDVFAACIAQGQWAAGNVPDSHRERVADMAAQLLVRLATAEAVLSVEPKGKA